LCLSDFSDRVIRAAILASRTPDISSDKTTTRLYYAAKIPEINISALAYFATSIFWRGSIHPWNDDGSIPVRLGPFQEQFRQYLLALLPFPKDCSLSVVVREGKEIDRLTYAPLGKREENFHVYKFPMPAIGFSIVVSKNIPRNYREKCFVHGHGNPIVVTTLIEEFLMADAVKMGQERLAARRSSKTVPPPRVSSSMRCMHNRVRHRRLVERPDAQIICDWTLVPKRLCPFAQNVHVARIGKQTVSAFAGRFLRNFEFYECFESTRDSGYG